MKRQKLVFLSGKRTPFGANGGALKAIHPTDLALEASKAALTQARVEPQDFDHVILGNVLTSTADAIYGPRHLGLRLGIPQDRPALGVNRLCGSGFQVIVEAYLQMLAGDARLALVGGVENMSLTPYLLTHARWGMRMGHGQAVDLLMEGLTDSYIRSPMAITAENLAERYRISREASDAFALRSQARAAAAEAAGFFASERITLKELERDEHPRPQSTSETLAKLKPVFKKTGVVTAANASGIVDGAAMLVVSTEEYAEQKNLKPLGALVSYGIVGCDPNVMGIGPVGASRIALERAGLKLDDMDIIEVNEAFAPQALAVQQELGIPDDKFNVNGGAIAIGHPLGASGSRITMTALYELQRRGGKYALVSACIGGGQGIALVIENLNR